MSTSYSGKYRRKTSYFIIIYYLYCSKGLMNISCHNYSCKLNSIKQWTWS